MVGGHQLTLTAASGLRLVVRLESVAESLGRVAEKR